MQSWFFWIGQSSCERRSTQCAESQVCGSLEAGVPFGTAGSDEGGAEFTPGTEGGAGGIAEGIAGLLCYQLEPFCCVGVFIMKNARTRKFGTHERNFYRL